MDKQRYFEEGKVARGVIALDVRDRRIKHDDLMDLIADPAVAEAFYGGTYDDKIPKDQWNEKYLEKLSYAVVSGGFNRDYLLYLEEVAEEVTRRKNRIRNIKIMIGGIVLAVIIIILAALICYGLTPYDQNYTAQGEIKANILQFCYMGIY